MTASEEIPERCFTVNLAKLLTNLFHRTAPGDCFRGPQDHINRQAKLKQIKLSLF